MNASSAKIWAQKQEEREKSLRATEKRKPKNYATQSFKRIYTAALVAALVLPLVGVGAYFYRQKARESALEVAGNIITVRAGGDFQAALDLAKAGDTIVLQAGAKYVGAFVLPNKKGNEFITIQSSELAKLPADNTRVSPQDAPLMPKVLSSGGGESAVKTAPNAHHYRFVGIEFAPVNKDYIYNLIALGTDDQKIGEIPHHIEIDRSYLHSVPAGITRRGIALNSADTIIKNSYLAGFAGNQEETQAIAGWNGTGGYKIINNYLEAGAENILFGGADPSIKGLIPTDIEIRNNYFTKPLEWRGKVTHKNIFELKNARRVLVVGNIFEHAFDCAAIVLTVRNQNGQAPWSVIEDVTIQNNLVTKSGSAVLILGTDDAYKSEVMKRVRIVNNLFTDINAEKWGEDGYFIKVNGGEDITVNNNTVFNSGNPITAYGAPSRRFTFRSNIISYGNYGFYGAETNGAGGTFAKYFADGTFAENVVVNSRRAEKQYIYVPPGNLFADDFKDVGFVNPAGGNYRLTRDSRYTGKGADIDTLEAEIKKAR